MTRCLTREGLRDLAVGAAILGSGGGGDPHIGMLTADQQLLAGRRIRVVSAAELPGDALVVPAAMMGAPTVIVEKLPSGTGGIAALRALEAHLGRSFSAIMPVECGGLNSMVPLALAAQLDLPVIDADGMGRAFPELQMVTFAVHGLPGAPMAMASDHGDVTILNTDDNLRLEGMARALTVGMGGTSYVSLWAMDAATVGRVAVPRTLTLAQDIGAALRAARARHDDPFDTLTEALGGRGTVLFRGKAVDVERRTTGGFARGSITLTALDDPDDRMVITFQNEHLTARHNSRLVAVVPDLICTLDADTGHAVTTERLAYGRRLTVYGIRAMPELRTPAALATWGPAAFGLTEAYRPLEELSPSATP